MNEFQKRLIEITDMLSIKNCDLSKQSGIDPSTLSRYKQGTRKPYRNGEEIEMLSNSILVLAKNRDRLLLQFFKCESNKELPQILLDYLNTNNLKIKKSSVAKKEKTILVKLGPKLDSIMNLLDISNVQLSYAIDINASLISRYRNKLRYINSNNIIIDKMASYFVECAKTEKRLYDLYRLIGSKEKYTEKMLLSILIEWLKDESSSLDDKNIEKFIKSISEYDYQNKSAYKIPSYTAKNDYWGVKDLTVAFNDFLAITNESKNLTQISIFFNYIQEDLFLKDSFKKSTLNYMQALLNKGNKIDFYQDTDNSIEEIVRNITIWLPLFFTTKFSYKYIIKATNRKFAQIIALSKNTGVLTSFGCLNAEDYIEHRIATDEKTISNYSIQFEELIKVSYPLLSSYNYENKDEYIRRYKDFHNTAGDITDYVSSPLLGTMPTNLLKKILSRYDLPEYQYQQILNLHELKSQTLMKSLANNSVTEYIAIDNPTPTVNASGAFLNIDIKYTKEEYKQHLSYLKELEKTNKNYKVNLIKSLPFSNIRLLIKKDVGTLIIRNDGNFEIVFVLQHNMLSEAFKNYIVSFINKK